MESTRAIPARRRALMLSLALTSACADGVAYFPTNGLALLLLVETSAGVPTLTALDPAQTLVRAAPTEDAFLLAYAEVPAGLSPGPIPLAASGRRLPSADRYARLVDDAWVDQLEVPDAIDALRIASSVECVVPEVERQPFEAPRFAVQIDARRALIETADRAFLASTTELVGLSTASGALAAFARDADIALVGPGHRFRTGHPERGYVDGPPLARPLRAGANLSGDPSGVELFATDASLAVQRFDGRAWTLIRDTSPPSTEKTRAQIAWSAAGRAALLGVEPNVVLELRADGAAQRVVLDLDSDLRGDSLWTAAYIAELGAVIGTTQGALHTRGGGAWRKRPVGEAGPRIDVLVDLGRGRVLGGGDLGVYLQWGPDESDVCPPLTGLGLDIGFVAAPVADGFLSVNGSGQLGYELITAKLR